MEAPEPSEARPWAAQEPDRPGLPGEKRLYFVLPDLQPPRRSTSMKLSEEALTYLNLGIQSEIAAYVFYLRVSKMIEDEKLRKILDKLAMDEKHHFLVLEDEYDRNVRSEMWAPYKDILVRDGLP